MRRLITLVFLLNFLIARNVWAESYHFDPQKEPLTKISQEMQDKLGEAANHIVDIIDLNNDSVTEIIANYKQVPLIFRRIRDDYVLACKDFPDVYDVYIKDLHHVDLYGPWDYALIAFSYAQKGDMEYAQAYYDGVLARASQDIGPESQTIKEYKQAVGEPVKAAQKFSDDPCPLFSVTKD